MRVCSRLDSRKPLFSHLATAVATESKLHPQHKLIRLILDLVVKEWARNSLGAEVGRLSGHKTNGLNPIEGGIYV